MAIKLDRHFVNRTKSVTINCNPSLCHKLFPGLNEIHRISHAESFFQYRQRLRKKLNRFRIVQDESLNLTFYYWINFKTKAAI
jgi:hypothetical protein